MSLFKFGTVLCLLFLTGCATIFNNNSQSIRVQTSNNQSVTAEVQQPNTEAYTLTVPNIIQARPSSFQPLLIQVNDPCFNSGIVSPEKSIKPIYWANIFTYFVGFPVDYLSGHMWEYDNVVTLHVKPKENPTEECKLEQAMVKDLPKPTRLKARFKSHRFSFGVTKQLPSNRRGTVTNDDLGFYLEHVYRLDSEMMTSLKYQYSSADNYYSTRCDGSFCSGDVSTNQNVFSFALRQYLTPNSNFYAGLGAAQVFISQTVNEYNRFSNFIQTEARTNSVFLDFGWQPRSSKGNFSFSGTIDFADLHLSTPTLNYTKKESNSNNSDYLNAKADGLFRHAAIISSVNLGVTLTF